MSNKIVEVTTTLESKVHAENIARKMVETRLAACVQIDGPITSVYRWQGEICESQEFRCTMKTIGQFSDALVTALLEAHPYDTPEVLVNEVESDPDYFSWLQTQILQNG